MGVECHGAARRELRGSGRVQGKRTNLRVDSRSTFGSTTRPSLEAGAPIGGTAQIGSSDACTLAFMCQVWAHPRFEALKLLEAADGAANASKTGARTLEPRQHFACAKPVPSECVWRDLIDARAFSC